MLSILILVVDPLFWVASIFDFGWRSAFSSAIKESLMTAGFSP
jgi:hypothetical protein